MMQIDKITQTDRDLDKLVASGDVLSYQYTDVEVTDDDSYPVAPYQSVVITLPSGRKLCIHSSSTPAPESSYLSFGVVDKDVKLT